MIAGVAMAPLDC